MKRDFIYLDWNVIKDLIDNKSSEFYEVINILKNQYTYAVPYSFAHLCDRQKNMSHETLPLINKDLEIVKTLTGNLMLGRFKDDYDIAEQDIFAKFNEVTAYNKNVFPQYNIPDEIVENLIKEGAKSFFTKEKNIVWYIPFMFTAMSRFNCNHQLYKTFREIFKMEPPTPDLQFFWDLQNPNITSKDLLVIVDNALAFETNNKSNLCEKLMVAYLYLDFSPTYREKVNKKTNFTNMCTDCEHMLNASHSKYYITEDKNTIKRTKFVFQAYDIKTKVFNIDEFIEFVKNGCSA